MAGENAILSAAGYGERRVILEAESHGLRIIANEDHGRRRRALYTVRRTSGSFSIDLTFPTFAAYQSFYNWFRGYCLRLIDPDGAVGPMRVRIPSRGFDKTGVPAGTYRFGIEVERVVERMTIAFRGARNPADHTVLSQFYPPAARVNAVGQRENLAAPYYYPAGVQLGGTERGEDYLYNHPLTDAEINGSPTRVGRPQ